MKRLDSVYKKNVHIKYKLMVELEVNKHGIHQKSYDDRRKKFHNDTGNNR